MKKLYIVLTVLALILGVNVRAELTNNIPVIDLDLAAIFAAANSNMTAPPPAVVPEITDEDIAEIKDAIKQYNEDKGQDAPVVFFQGKEWNGPTTHYAGMEIANVYSMFQAPGKYTWGEWTTALAGAVGGYYLYEELADAGSSGSDGSGRGPTGSGGNSNDGNSGAGGNSVTVNGNIVNSTVFVQLGSNDPQGEGHNSQGTSNSDGTVSSDTSGK